jgi:hypothetical protein
MPRKRFTSEQIIGKLREAEVRLAQGEPLPDVCRVLAVSEQTFYRWRKEFGGLKLSDAFCGRCLCSSANASTCARITINRRKTEG